MLQARQLGLIILITILGLIIAYAANLPLVVGFSAGLIMLIIVSYKLGLTTPFLLKSMSIGIAQAREVIWLMLLVGIILPCWAESGTLGELVRWALALLNPNYALTLSFLIASCMSMILGTSVGTLSSVGVPLIGMASHLGIPLPYIAGAVISGAFVGDRTSPFSSAFQLVSNSTETAVFTQWRALAPTSAASFVVSASFFYWLDVHSLWNTELSTDASLPIKHADHALILLLPVAVLLGSILLRVKTKYGFMLSIATSIVIGSVAGSVTLSKWAHVIWFGSDEAFVKGTGLLQMLGIVTLIAAAGAFNGIIERSNMIGEYMQKVAGLLSSLTNATLRTALFGLVLGLIACNQALPVMMSSRGLLPFWKTRYPQAQLARVISDTSSVFPTMIPWNLLAVLYSTLVGLPVSKYLPYSIFLWSLPLFTFVFSMYKDRVKGK